MAVVRVVLVKNPGGLGTPPEFRQLSPSRRNDEGWVLETRELREGDQIYIGDTGEGYYVQDRALRFTEDGTLDLITIFVTQLDDAYPCPVQLESVHVDARR